MEKDGFTILEGKLSIQAESGNRFAEQVLHIPRRQMSVMIEGYRPEFKVEPSAYH